MIVINADLLEESFDDNVYNFTQKKQQMNSDGLSFDDWILKLTVSIESTYCEVSQLTLWVLSNAF